MAYRLIFIQLIFLCRIACAAAIDAEWHKAVESYQSGNFSLAAQRFESWSETHGQRSPEALYNLSLCEWKEKQNGLAMFHLLQSTRLRSAPWRTAFDLRTASELEKKIGIKDGLTDRPLFQLAFLINSNCAAILGMASFWLFAALALLGRPRKRHLKLKILTLSLALGGVLLILVACGSYLVHKFASPYGVIVENEASPSLVRVPSEKAPERVVDLPSGTVVSLGAAQGQYTEIEAPLAGWVETSTVRRLTP